MDALDTVASWLREAKSVLVLTGAGVSAESGIPTFRGDGGLWEGFRAEELGTPQGFAADPERVWRWYRMRRRTCLGAEPNPGHFAIAKLQRHRPASKLLTQNIDGLHARAGSTDILELHGNIHSDWCPSCERVRALPPPGEEPQPMPRCERCGAPTRPRVLWFGESYWPGVIDAALQAAQTADVALVVGTSGMVTVPVAIAEHAQQAGARLIDVNPAASSLSELADAWLAEPAGRVLPELMRRAFG